MLFFRRPDYERVHHDDEIVPYHFQYVNWLHADDWGRSLTDRDLLHGLFRPLQLSLTWERGKSWDELNERIILLR